MSSCFSIPMFFRRLKLWFRKTWLPRTFRPTLHCHKEGVCLLSAKGVRGQVLCRRCWRLENGWVKIMSNEHPISFVSCSLVQHNSAETNVKDDSYAKKLRMVMCYQTWTPKYTLTQTKAIRLRSCDIYFYAEKVGKNEIPLNFLGIAPTNFCTFWHM